MMFVIPTTAIPFIRLQRTEYGNADVTEAYAKDIKQEFESLKPHLPRRVYCMADIGCGVAGIDAFLYPYLEKPDMYLVDKGKPSAKLFYGFHDEAAFYNDFDEMKKLLLVNNVEERHIHPIEVGKNNRIRILGPLELVISLYSWGFHYPVATYVAKVADVLSTEGVLILDVRNGTGGEKDLQEHFAVVKEIGHGPKHIRYLCRLQSEAV